MDVKLRSELAAKYKAARTKEKLDHKEAAALLGLKTHYYSHMLSSQNPEIQSKASGEAWEILRDWAESGMKIREYDPAVQNAKKAMSKQQTEPEPKEKEVPKEDYEPEAQTAPDENPTVEVGKTDEFRKYFKLGLRAVGITYATDYDLIAEIAILINEKGERATMADFARIESKYIK